MHLPEGIASQHSLALIAEIHDHLTRLQREDSGELALFRQSLADLLRDETNASVLESRFDHELRKIRLHALRNREEERARLAEQLRAGPGELLANAVVELVACLPLLDIDVKLVRRGLQALEEELRAGLDKLRQILSELEPPQLMKELGLMDSLQAYTQRLAKQSGITVEFHFPAQAPRFPPTMEIGIYRVVQGALRNAIEHGQASTVVLIVEQKNGGWRFAVQDDGSGFDPLYLSHASGLVNMYEWANAFGGTLEVQSKPGHGTTVVLTVDTESTG
jgi:two-component system sensor histidine kinase DegS